MLFVNWIPGGAPRTEKMSYAMFANAVRAAFVGIHSNMQANTLADLEWVEVVDRVARFEVDKTA
eukprot:m.942495 g.942495  ORF g.942495 m.942495 type:complete len:64 (-) comp263911_c0_seq1:37-228(-)